MAGNQYKPDPRQSKFLEYYLDTKSDTFSNALQSALKAGYSQEYSENITTQMPEWLLENLGNMKRLRKAEKNLSEVQDLSILNEDGKPDPQLIDKRTKVDIFIAETVGKSIYSKRKEFTGAGGERLYDPEQKAKMDKLLEEAFNEEG